MYTIEEYRTPDPSYHFDHGTHIEYHRPDLAYRFEALNQSNNSVQRRRLSLWLAALCSRLGIRGSSSQAARPAVVARSNSA